MSNSTVELLEHMGTDLTVVNAARVSFDKKSDWEYDISSVLGTVPQLFKKDADLIEYLATGLRKKERRNLQDEIIRIGVEYNNGDYNIAASYDFASAVIDRIQSIQKHWSPFSHPQISLRIYCPVFVARQLHRSGVGFAPPIADEFGFSEESRRYVDAAPEFYDMEEWRKRDADVKQGSGSAIEQDDCIQHTYNDSMKNADADYSFLLGKGVSPEQARALLPMSLMTRFIWTGSLWAWANLCRQRLDNHTQKETQEIACLIAAHMSKLFPVSWKALIRC